MAWEQDSFGTEVTPVVGKIREADPSFFILAVDMVFIHKPIDTVTLADVALIVLSVVLVGDLLFELKKIWEERLVLGSRYQGLWRFWDVFWHVRNMDGNGGEIIGLDEIRLLLDSLGRLSGMSMTVPEQSVCAEGSSWAMQVPGG